MILSNKITLHPQIATNKSKEATIIYKILSCLWFCNSVWIAFGICLENPLNENIVGTLDYESRGLYQNVL